MPVSKASKLTIVVPNFPDAPACSPDVAPSLAQLGGLGSGWKSGTPHLRLESWQQEFLTAAELDQSSADYASAPLTRWGADDQPADGTWLHADAIRLEASRTGMTLRRVGQLTPGDLQQLVEVLTARLADEGFAWSRTDTALFAHSPVRLDIETRTPSAAAHLSLREALPRGPDAARIRCILTEAQMLIHELRGESSAYNALWLWGDGAPKLLSRKSLPRLFTNDAFTRGVYSAHGAQHRCLDLPENLQGIVERTEEQSAIVVLRNLKLPEQEQQWFGPALSALRKRRVDIISLCLDGRQTVARRSFIRHWFRKRDPVGQALSGESR